ncbi:MAG: hypothetical protein Phyf2KO_27490 [Phycisphaerales bacterium]
MTSNTRTFAAAASLLIVASLAAALGAGIASSRLAPTTVAVLDIDRLSAEMDEFKVPSEEFQAKQASRREELRSIQTRISSIAEELELIPDDDQDARINKLTEQVRLDSEFKALQQMFQQASDLEQAQLFKSMFDRIEAGAAQIAQRDGIDIVLVDDRVFTLSPNNRAAQSAALESKKLLFANETVDITDELLTMLNNEFNAGK